jgi:hypothetical protein
MVGAAQSCIFENRTKKIFSTGCAKKTDSNDASEASVCRSFAGNGYKLPVEVWIAPEAQGNGRLAA